MSKLIEDESDPLGYVRGQLATLKEKALTVIAVKADLTVRTLYNIRDGKEAKYSTVIKLRDVLRAAELADPAQPAKK